MCLLTDRRDCETDETSFGSVISNIRQCTRQYRIFVIRYIYQERVVSMLIGTHLDEDNVELTAAVQRRTSTNPL